MSKDRFSTLDLHTAAFLELHGIKPTLVMQGQRVVFSFQDGKAHDLAEQFNSNAQVPVADYVAVLKALRGRMYQAKQ